MASSLYAPRNIFAQEIPDEIAIQVLVGEAGDQGIKGMICVGEVLRRRASTKGFHGYESHMYRKQPKSAWRQAATAWTLSAHTNYTKGADHFDNVRSFGRPWWAKYCVKTYTYKDHVFYKEIDQRYASLAK